MPPTSPVPGRPARGSSSGQPFSVLLDLLGRRWSLTVLWSLRDGPLTFSAIKDTDERMANGTLSARLRELGTAGLVEKTRTGAYTLTPMGNELIVIGEPIASWSLRWAATFDEPEPAARP